MPQVRRQGPALAALVDCWGQGVKQAWEPFGRSPRWRQGVDEGLLPMVYGEPHVARTRCRRRQDQRQAAWEAVRAALDQHASTPRLAPHGLAAWQAWAWQRTQAFPRPASAVEGRNGSWSPRHHNHRGWPRRRYTVWTIVHNFDGRAMDGTTPASRCFRRTFPALFATVVLHIEALPQPRRRKPSHSRRRRMLLKINDLSHSVFVNTRPIESITYAFYAVRNAASFELNC
jgi:hypothetical protein